MHERSRRSPTLAILLVASIAACSGDDTAGVPDTTVDAFISRVAVAGGATAALRDGEPPQAGGGPAVATQSNATAIIGGSLGLGLTAGSAFQRVFVAVEGEGGYYDLQLPAAGTAATLLITLNQNVGNDGFTITVAAATASGAVGGYAQTDVTPIEVGTGEVQVSVSWDAASDVDLHVVDPDGEEIYYGNRASDSGGELDLDSNPACFLDNTNNENITWESGAPAGEYIVRVNYWDSCDVAATNYVVTIQITGRQPQVFTGQLTGEGTHGGLGDGIEVTRFTL